MTRIAYLVSSARELALADGSMHLTGYFTEQALKPYEHFEAAGLDVTVITPDGQPPMADSYGLLWFFHYPRDDQDYLASVVRTFAHNDDGIRLTLHQSTSLGLAAARRVAALLQAHGHSAPEAHRTVSAAAKAAWRQDKPLADVLTDDGSHGLSRGQVRAAIDAQRADCERLAETRHAKLQAIHGFQQPVALSSLTDAEIEQFDAVFVPGGHGPMTDLSDNSDAGRLLFALHHKGAPIAALSHGAAVLLSAPERADGLWLFDGYRMTSITDEEEDQTEMGHLGMAWRLDVALKNAGAVFDDGPSAWLSHVVVDRNLITGQNPASTDAAAGAVLKKLQTPIPQAGIGRRTRHVVHEYPRAKISPTDTVQAFLDAFARHDVDAGMILVSPQVSVSVHPLGVQRTGANALRQVLVDLLRSFPDLLISLGRVITTGEVVTALFVAAGTQSADYATAINQRKHLDIDQAWRFVVDDGVIIEVSAYWCQAQLYRRLAVKRYDQIAIA